MARNSNERWTPAEDKRLLKLRTDGKSNVSIAAALHRSLSSVQGRIYLMKRAAGREQPLQPTGSGRNGAPLMSSASAR